MLATFAWVNVRGVAMGARLVEVITVTKLLPLLLLTVTGLFSGETRAPCARVGCA